MDLHDPTEPSERVLRTVVDVGDVEAGERVGRYTVLERLGEGGMGTVWSAFDPTLDRKVALKFLHGAGGDSEPAVASGGKDPLLREAQALAKLSHPNVVAVHEVDTHRGRVFMALELVQGKTLKKWLTEKRHWREVLRALIEAGRGLAAAHAAGIVHRDVKPANILVGDDGRVRISDFGLARPEAHRKSENRAAPTGTTGTEEVPAPGGSGGGDGDGVELAGTPGYMAPEQQRGLAVDARADLFSFCVTAYEALCGVRPFPRLAIHGDASEADSSVATQPSSSPPLGRPSPLPPPAPGFRPPQRILRVLGRGLSADPTHRYASMNALLGALERQARPVRPAFIATAAAVALVAIPILATRAGREACAAGPELVGRAWGPDHRERLAAAFASAGAPGKEALERAAELLDARAGAWAAAYRDACEATRVQRGQSEAVLDLRLGCLETRRQELVALVRLLEGADAALSSRAPDAVQSLPGVEQCANVVALSMPLPPPADPAARRQIAGLSERQTAVTAQIAAGRYKPALDMLEPLIAEAEKLQYAPLQAQLWRNRARLLNPLGRVDDAIDSLTHAITSAERGRDDLERARSCAMLGYSLGFYKERSDDGYRWIELAVATYQRNPSPEDEGEALNLWVAVLTGEGKTREALRVLERLEKLIALNLPPDHALAYRALLKRATLLISTERSAEAAEVAREAVALGTKQRGPRHPIVAAARLIVAGALIDIGKTAEARAELDQAEPIFRATMPDSASMVELQADRAEIEDREGRTAAAVALAGDVLVPLRKRAGDEHSSVVQLLGFIGDAQRRLGRTEEAARTLEEALRIASRINDRADSPKVRVALAKLLWATNQDPARALALAKAAAADTAEAGGRTHREAQALVAAHEKAAATGPGPH